MANFTIKNEKGLVSDVSLNHVMTYAGVQYLENLLSENPEKFSEKPTIVEDAKQFLHLIKKLHVAYPYLRASFIQDWKDDHGGAPDINGFDVSPYKGYVIPTVDIFKSNSPSIQNVDMPAQFESFGWQYCEDLSKLLKKIAPYLECANIWVNSSVIENGKKLFKKIHSWEISEPKVEDLLLSESYAIYKPSFNGFLNDKGSFLPLAGARLFESAESASRTAKSRSLTDVVIVKTHVQVIEVCHGYPRPESLGPLAEALSIKEARELHADLKNKETSLNVEERPLPLATPRRM